MDNNHRRQATRPPENATDEELAKHASWRRHTKSYRAKRHYVRDLWIYSGALIIFLPLPVQIFCLAALSFLSLSILDSETQ